MAPIDTSRDNVRLGLLCQAGALLCLAALNAFVAILTRDGHDVLEVAFWRNVTAFVPVLLLIAVSGGPRLLVTRRLPGHLLRGAVGSAGILCFFSAFALLPQAEATAILYAAPIIMTALAVPLLGERVGIHRWSAVLVGFLGVLVVADPGGALWGWGLLAAIGGAFTQATAMILIRRLGQTEHPATTVFYFTLIASAVTGLAVAATGVGLTWADWPILALTGLIGGTAQVLLTVAYRYAPASILAPFSYSSILLGTLSGILVFGERPGWNFWLGALLIVGSGLYILRREVVRRRPIVRDTPPPQT